MLQFIDVSKVCTVLGRRRRVLKNASFRLERGRHFGILTHARADKSALIRLACGADNPTTGTIVRTMSLSWPMGLVSAAIQQKNSGHENLHFIAQVYGRPVADVRNFVADLSGLHQKLNDPVSTYEPRLRAQFCYSLSLAVDFDCYVIDENPVAGEREFVARFRSVLAERLEDRALFMVSTNLRKLRQYCDEIVQLKAATLGPLTGDEEPDAAPEEEIEEIDELSSGQDD